MKQNYLDSRTPEERANEPKSKTTMTKQNYNGDVLFEKYLEYDDTERAIKEIKKQLK